MAELSTLARPYARAAFEYARDNNALAEWQSQLATAAAVTLEPAMDGVLNNPALTADQQADTLIEVCGEAVGAAAQNFLRILASNKRLALLPQIHVQFAQFKANQEKAVDVEVISAFDLDSAVSERLAQVLGKKLERDVNVSTTTDSELLGGVLIRAGDMVIDGSVRGRLNKLAEAMNS
jgi:F-type H+-transporting ATPase subunit delta